MITYTLRDDAHECLLDYAEENEYLDAYLWVTPGAAIDTPRKMLDVARAAFYHEADLGDYIHEVRHDAR